MKTLIPEQVAIVATIIILSAMVIFHLFVLAGIIPYTIVAGGRIENKSQMVLLETIATAVNLLMLIIVLMKADVIKTKLSPLAIRVAFWIMFFVFVLNTVGNILAKTEVEKWVFTPLTFVLALFSLRLASSLKGMS